MPINGYKNVFIKIVSAIVSAITFSLYSSWIIYTPVSERLSEVGYHSFSGIFAVNFVPNFFVFIILGVILSPLIDRIIFRKFNLNGIKGILTIVLSYLLLGVVSGLLASIFFFNLYYILVSILGAILFLFFQTVFHFVLFR
ncbi:hypothetical protein GN156_10625 [bacterium LRH843]|nr:hypothetical protein [bacterium LRH843]